MGHTLDDYPPRQAEKWLDSVREFFRNRNLIYSLDVDRFDDKENTDVAMRLFQEMTAGATTLDVFVSVDIYNADAEQVMSNGYPFDVEDMRFYESVECGNYVETIEFEQIFEY